MSDKTFALISPLSPEECVARLNKAITPPPAMSRFPDEWALQESHPVRGQVTSEELLLHCHVLGRNTFKSQAIGSIDSLENGSRIVGRFSMHPNTGLFLGCWLGGLFIIGLPGFLHIAGSLRSGAVTFGGLWEKSYLSDLGPLGLMAAGILMNFLSRSQFGYESNTIKHFLSQVLEAHEEQPPQKS